MSKPCPVEQSIVEVLEQFMNLHKGVIADNPRRLLRELLQREPVLYARINKALDNAGYEGGIGGDGRKLVFKAITSRITFRRTNFRCMTAWLKEAAPKIEAPGTAQTLDSLHLPAVTRPVESYR